VSGLVRRIDKILPSSGSGVRLDPSKTGVALGIDFGQHHHRIILTDIHGQPFAPDEPVETRAPTGQASRSVDWAVANAEELLQKANRTAADVRAVGISLPGPVNRHTKKLYQAQGNGSSPQGSAVPMDLSWQVVDIGGAIQAKLGVPPPIVESDYNASALAEHLWGATRFASDALYVKISQRCAFSLLINHRIYRGSDGYAGRIGQTRMDTDDGEIWAPVEDAFSLGIFRKLIGDHKSADEIVWLAKTDANVDEALRRGAKALGIAIAPIIDALNPASLVIGGALGVASFDWVAAELLDGIMALGPSPARSTVSQRMRAGEFARASAVRGVAASALLDRAPFELVTALSLEETRNA
jgi:predicted NBD/HSP70 family sugar kinase